jgi:3D (Asp-Asp-Asp) domain-containing protein
MIEAFLISTILPTLQGTAFLQPAIPPQEERLVIVTAYSSTVDQCDATPFITASGKRVKDGIVAANFLPFGTKVIFPDLFGDKVFTVEDRMHRKNSHKVDIWMPSRWRAKQFGKKKARMIVL